MFIQSLFADFACPSTDDNAGEFKGALIAAFETAIDQGVSPQMAIATVLEWVAEECARMQVTVKTT